MIYSDFNTPSENMNLPLKQIADMVREQNEALYKAEEDKVLREQSQAERAYQEYTDGINKYIESRNASLNNRATFLEAAKSGFLAAAMLRLFKESYDGDFTKRTEVIAKNMINSFIQEQGVGDLLLRFKYQNTTVAEMSRIVQEAYDKLIDSLDGGKDKDESEIPGRAKELHLDKTIVDDFYKDIEDLDTTEASKMIKDKVADAMAEFIDQNNQQRHDYEEVINVAKEKMEDVKEESSIESTVNEAKRQINEMKRTRNKNVFHYLVEAITKETFKDENLGKRYMHETTIDMDSIVEAAKINYTLLEMLNTTEMVEPEYIKNYIQDLVAM